jgi:hypothetical protein
MVASTFLLMPDGLRAQGGVKPAGIPSPPMGWSSWNSFSNTVDSQVVVAQANAMVSSGMKRAGYEYVNIDEGWWLGERDEKGNIVVDPKAWPALSAGERAGDMSNIVRYIHGLGLKAGIYTDAGSNGCGTYSPDLGPGYPGTGSEGHYEQDFLQFAKWGFDYVKVDYCGASEENLDPAAQYAEITRAIALAETATGHRLYLSICAGRSSPWMWAPGVGGILADIWRTGSDIVGPVVAHTQNAYMSPTCTKGCPRGASFQRVLRNFDQNIHPEAQHTGFYNDPDMMVLGMPGLTDAENRVHMSLWAMAGAPLILGADLLALSPASLAMLTNPDVVQVDQDSLGLQCVKVTEMRPGLEVWSKRMSTPGTRAVLLLNRTGEEATISVDWGDLGLLGTFAGSVRDVWSGKNLRPQPKPISATVAAADAVMLLVRGEEIKPHLYIGTCRSDVDGVPCDRTAASNRSLRFTGVASRSRVAAIQINYRNSGKESRIVELRVNGQAATRIAFPPTGSDSAVGTIWIQAVLDHPGSTNVLSFSAAGEAIPGIESTAVN